MTIFVVKYNTLLLSVKKMKKENADRIKGKYRAIISPNMFSIENFACSI